MYTGVVGGNVVEVMKVRVEGVPRPGQTVGGILTWGLPGSSKFRKEAIELPPNVGVRVDRARGCPVWVGTS